MVVHTQLYALLMSFLHDRSTGIFIVFFKFYIHHFIVSHSLCLLNNYYASIFTINHHNHHHHYLSTAVMHDDYKFFKHLLAITLQGDVKNQVSFIHITA